MVDSGSVVLWCHHMTKWNMGSPNGPSRGPEDPDPASRGPEELLRAPETLFGPVMGLLWAPYEHVLSICCPGHTTSLEPNPQ
jgi:hypothetical protein